jgi:hypothetical protein
VLGRVMGNTDTQDSPRPKLGGEATTFLLILYFVTFHGGHIKMAFCLETPKWESRNRPSWDSRDFGAHNFTSRPPMEMRSVEKL